MIIHLANLGHRSVAYIGANSALSSGRERLSAYLQGLKDAGLEANEKLIYTSPRSFEMGRISANGILDQQLATVAACGGFEIFNGALSALMTRGLNPNTDFAFIGYGDPSFYSWIDGGISTINLPVEDLAYCAVARIEGRKNGKFEYASDVSRFPATLTIRGGVDQK